MTETLEETLTAYNSWLDRQPLQQKRALPIGSKYVSMKPTLLSALQLQMIRCAHPLLAIMPSETIKPDRGKER